MSTSVGLRLLSLLPGACRPRPRTVAARTHVDSLDALPTGVAAVVRGLAAPATLADWAPGLEALGFVAGEHVRVMARARPGGDPLVVRVGNSTFALRRAEAACVRLEPAAP